MCGLRPLQSWVGLGTSLFSPVYHELLKEAASVNGAGFLS